MTDDELHVLAQEFFKTFARSEFALKATGFHKVNGDAEVDWRKFAVSIQGLFEEPQDPQLAAALDYILNAPPKKQVVIDGVIDWLVVPVETNSKADRILLYVRRVRNNLFHGGKFNGHWFDPERSEHLLRHGITILLAAVAHSPIVREAYA